MCARASASDRWSLTPPRLRQCTTADCGHASLASAMARASPPRIRSVAPCRLKARKGAKGYKRKVLKAHATLPDLLSSQLGMGGLARALEKRAMWLAISERRELMRAQALGVLQ
jgi:hypothetical protein